MSDRPIATIDLGAFSRNVGTLVATVAPSSVMLAVKADAYGHGMLPIARAALEAGATSLAVLDVPAALELRAAGITAPLFAWLHGVNTDFDAAVRNDVDLGVSAVWQLEAIRAAASPGQPARVHLKVDTGLSRNGASAEDWPGLVRAALEAEAAGDVRVAAIWSHLADASPADDAVALDRLTDAIAVAASLGLHPELVHLAASSAGLRMPEARFDLVRFGIAAYGISPFDDVDGKGLGLAPVMTLRSIVTDVGEGTAKIGAGFGDGILPQAIGSAEVLVAGTRRRVLSIDVDSLTVDASGVSVGDDAVVFGSGDGGEPTAEEWASWAGTIGDEVVAKITSRVPREYR